MSIMFVDGAEPPSTNIMDMVSPHAPGFALWNKLLSVSVSLPECTKCQCHGSVAPNVSSLLRGIRFIIYAIANAYLLLMPTLRCLIEEGLITGGNRFSKKVVKGGGVIIKMGCRFFRKP